MANAILIPGFLTQAMTFGFRIGATQIAGHAEIEKFISEPNPAFDAICGGKPPALLKIFTTPRPASSTTANERVMEGFIALLDVVTDGMEEDLDSAMKILTT